MRKAAAWLIVLTLLAPNSGWSVMHFKPGVYPNARRDDIHHPTAAQLAKAQGSYRAAITNGSTGAKTVAVIIVQFPSANPSLCSGNKSIQSPTNIDSYFTKMNQYYQEVSYGNIPSITFKFFGSNTNTVNGDATAATAGAYTLGQPMESYGCGDEGVGCNGVTPPTGAPAGTVNAFGDYLIRDALAAARAGHSTTPAASNAGGIFDAVIVMHAGNGNETTTSNGDIWSIFYSQDNIIPSAGGGFTEGDVVPETESSGITSPLGVMCHEFGHELGLPDLYNTTVSGGSSVVGDWELMDEGPFDGNGANPSHMGAWDKQFLGWTTPTTVTSQSTNSIGYVETANPSILKIPVQNGLAQEYFLVEYRSTSSGAQFDQKIPGTGLLIWHVDDAITAARGIAATDPNLQNTVNSGNPHYGVSIISQDGVPVSAIPDGGTAFGNNDNFESPKSNNFNGQPSGIILLNISGIGSGTASMTIENFQVAVSQSIVKLINYPNPAGKGYPHPNGEMHTTIQVQLARPPNDLSMNIYTLSGDLVRKLGSGDILHNSRNDDANQKFVYEYVWDLKNGDGAMVAPGVYFYLVRADGQTKSGKAVIIR